MKKQSILLFGILLAISSSCVYSLFPIYTEDTLVFKPELLGKWAKAGSSDTYIIFESDYLKKSSSNESTRYTDSVSGDTWSMKSDKPIFIEYKGRKVFDKDSIRLLMNEKMSALKESTKDIKVPTDESRNKDFLDQMKTNKDFSGTITIQQEKSYIMRVVNKGEEEEKYVVHLVEIQGELYLDVYPETSFNSLGFSHNYFPVHTFMKINLTKDRLDINFFDLDKLNKLFTSNLIRIRHENVDGTILITAQPEEMQKFLSRYSNDQSVFENTEVYRRLPL